MKTYDLPDDWPKKVRSAMLQVVSLAHASLVHSRSWCADSPLVRVKLAGKLNGADHEISLLHEELRIKDARMEKIMPHNRPFYPPVERMAILELKAARAWNLAQAARAFLVDSETIASWMKDANREQGASLVGIAEPMNKFPAFVRHVVRRLKVLCPTMGKKRIAETLARAGLHLAATTVGRMLKAKLIPPTPFPAHHSSLTDQHSVVTARHPNHVWHVDLTVVPTSAGFWVPWFPFTLLQVWPFAYWVAVIVDHFSRKVMGFAVFRKQPSSLEVRAFLGRAIHKARVKPRHLISDRGSQFDCADFRKWAKRKKIKLRYGAVGKYGSIAIIERFILSLKSEFTNQLPIPLDLDEFRHELAHYADWYNNHRPHQALDGRTPQDVYSGSPQASPADPEPNSRLPIMELVVSQLHGNKLLPIVQLKKAA